jgi:O-antigen/teichoic acid export membrane protein
MSLITIVLTLIVVGILLWFVNGYIPMDAKIKKILNILVVVLVVVWLLNVCGVVGYIRNIHASMQPPARNSAICRVITQSPAQT